MRFLDSQARELNLSIKVIHPIISLETLKYRRIQTNESKARPSILNINFNNPQLNKTKAGSEELTVAEYPFKLVLLNPKYRNKRKSFDILIRRTRDIDQVTNKAIKLQISSLALSKLLPK